MFGSGSVISCTAVNVDMKVVKRVKLVCDSINALAVMHNAGTLVHKKRVAHIIANSHRL